MILVDETQSQTDHEPGQRDETAHELRQAVDRAWHDDVALEMWIDVTSNPVGIRLEGVLDGSTGSNLAAVVDDCMAQGRWDFALDTGALHIACTGWEVIDRMRERVCAAGGHVYWDGAAE